MEFRVRSLEHRLLLVCNLVMLESAIMIGLVGYFLIGGR
jgi:hypothetical protein